MFKKGRDKRFNRTTIAMVCRSPTSGRKKRKKKKKEVTRLNDGPGECAVHKEPFSKGEGEDLFSEKTKCKLERRASQRF